MEQMTLFGSPEKIDNRFKDYEGKIEHAKKVIRLAADISNTYYKAPLIIAYSGGKDSDVLLDIAIKSGIEFEVLHSITTVDAADTNRHVNKVFSRLKGMGITAKKRVPTWRGEKTNMWEQIVNRQIPPTRLARYCCAVLKEASTPNRIVALGVRSDESAGRGGAFRLLDQRKEQARSEVV